MLYIRTTAVAVIVASLALVAPVHTQAQTPTVDEIVARHVASRGGAEKWASIQTQRMAGTLYTQDIEIGMVMLTRRPNLGRQELTIELPGQDPVPILNVFDGTKAWTINPLLSGPTTVELTGRDAGMMRDQSELESPLIDYRAKGHTVEFVGTETIGNRRAYRLKVTRTGQPAAHYFVDAETGVELRIAPEGVDAPVLDFSDHRAVDGILVPHHIRIQQTGQNTLEIVLSSVEFNVPADDVMFRRP